MMTFIVGIVFGVSIVYPLCKGCQMEVVLPGSFSKHHTTTAAKEKMGNKMIHRWSWLYT